MGKLLYGSSKMEVVFDDRVMAHLQLVISTKLRRHEAFFFSWRDDPAIGDGRSSVWLDSSIPLQFRYSSPERHQLNREWLDELTHSANQPTGLVLSTEPGEEISRPRTSV